MTSPFDTTKQLPADETMWTRLQRRLVEAGRAEAARQAAKLDPEMLARDVEEEKAKVMRRIGMLGGQRCPDCGYWLSTRYSASQPHQCEAIATTDEAIATAEMKRVAAGVPLAGLPESAFLNSPTLTGRLVPPLPKAKPGSWGIATMQGGQPRQPIILPPAAPAHGFKWWARYPWPKNRPTAPASPAAALALAWLCGAACGALVAILVASLLPPG